MTSSHSTARYGKDGVTDFTKLADADLEEARVRTDYAIHPIDHGRIRAEIQRRKLKRRRKLQPIMQKAAGGFLLAGAVMLLGRFGNLAQGQWAWPPGTTPATSLGFMIAAVGCLAVLSGVAGILLLRKMPAGLYLGAAALALQILHFHVAGLDYRLIPLASVVVLWQAPFDFGYSLAMGPAANVLMAKTMPLTIGVDLISLQALIILLRGIARARRAQTSLRD